MKRTVAIVHARNRTQRLWVELSRLLASRGKEPEVHYTEFAGHARQLAADHVPEDGVVLAVGGDGTFNEVINGWMDQSQRGRPAFVLVPLGTGNDFARDQEILADAEKLAQAVLQPRFKEIDLGHITYQAESQKESRYFVVGATVGFSAEVTRFFCTLPRLLPGTTQYLFSLLVSLLRWKNASAELVSDDEQRVTSKLFNLNIANTRFYGGGMYSSPRAVVDSGFLESVVMELSKLEVVRALPKTYSGKFDLVRGVTQRAIQEINVSSATAIPVQADGEYLGSTPIEVRVIERGLKLGVYQPTTA
jgi:diacylglycerol kinase (ATP)